MDGGSSWTLVNQELDPVAALAIIDTNVFAVPNDGALSRIYRSVDDGHNLDGSRRLTGPF